jgi:hypothetical protein
VSELPVPRISMTTRANFPARLASSASWLAVFDTSAVLPGPTAVGSTMSSTLSAVTALASARCVGGDEGAPTKRVAGSRSDSTRSPIAVRSSFPFLALRTLGTARTSAESQATARVPIHGWKCATVLHTEASCTRRSTPAESEACAAGSASNVAMGAAGCAESGLVGADETVGGGGVERTGAGRVCAVSLAGVLVSRGAGLGAGCDASPFSFEIWKKLLLHPDRTVAVITTVTIRKTVGLADRIHQDTRLLE